MVALHLRRPDVAGFGKNYPFPSPTSPDAKTPQRPFGGHTREFGKAPVRRSCYAADRTGHMILQTLYQQCIRHQVKFFNEFLVLELLVDSGRAGVPLEDMEFFQFHPTGIYRLGILITEAARGEGGKLINGRGERFMEKYAPTLGDLAPRDIVSRCIYLALRQGHGINGKWYVHLDLTHLGREVIESKLPDITDFVRTYLGLDPVKEPIPVQPTAHYAT